MNAPKDASVNAGAGAGSEDRDKQVRYRLMSVRNSSRVFCCVRKQPSMQDVTVTAPGFCTPRIVMHMCLHVRPQVPKRIRSGRQRSILRGCGTTERGGEDEGREFGK